METEDIIRLETAPEEDGLPLDRLLLRRLPDMTRNKIRALLAHGRLRLNQEAPTGPAVPLKSGDQVEILSVDRDAPSLMFEDPGFMVFYKPAGMDAERALRVVGVTHSRFHRRPLHRLVEMPDERISGVALCTAQPRVFRMLTAAFSGGGAMHVYQALVEPPPETASGPLAGAPGWSFKVERRFQGCSLVLLMPPPTRGTRPLTALAKAHLRPMRLSRSGSLRLAVHVRELTFRHPRTGRRLSYHPGLSPAFKALLEKQIPMPTLAADLPAIPPQPSLPEEINTGPEPALRSPRVKRRPRRSGRGR
jgi:23S rRNA-/tRNA-specific pseudouridylate synthase